MSTSRLDAITGFFARSRAARRASREATPEVTPGGPPFLFVQSFEGGTVMPKAGAEGTYTLTLQHALGQTLFFSDRPERIVGVAPTARFLDNLGFSPDNPPNAAIVIDGQDGVDIAVVELTNPAYDDTNATATYDISVLREFEHDVGVQMEGTLAEFSSGVTSFGNAHLFIDDCPDRQVYCHYDDESQPPRSIGMQGFCWSWSMFECKFCDYDAAVNMCYSRLPDFCNDRSPACTPIAD